MELTAEHGLPDRVLEPELYALVHRGTPGDEAFYLGICAGASTVLELGCGYGRLLSPLAAAGHRVTGVDRDEGLLVLARDAAAALPPAARERIRLLRADMREVCPGQRFQRVLIPYNGLYCLPTAAEQVRCLARAAAMLEPDGLLAFDAYAIDGFHAGADPDDADPEAIVAKVHWRGEPWDVLETSGWNRDAQRLHVRYRYRSRTSGRELVERLDHRYLLTTQITGLCAAAGLQVVSARGGFQDQPLTPDSGVMACVAAAA